MDSSGSEDEKALRVLVHGRVQGVGFRYWALRNAERLGLSGWVRNEPDGSVLLECSGASSLVDSFVTLLRRGPPGALIQNLDIQPLSISSRPRSRGFRVDF